MTNIDSSGRPERCPKPLEEAWNAFFSTYTTPYLLGSVFVSHANRYKSTAIELWHAMASYHRYREYQPGRCVVAIQPATTTPNEIHAKQLQLQTKAEVGTKGIR